MVGDSIFPGQSTGAVALGGLRVAHTILARDPVLHGTNSGAPVEKELAESIPAARQDAGDRVLDF
ncbi:MAG: hypothetical protein P1P76_02555 [Anaerolineales bacterium]|nr:hypothetical protein [Anaerolineales bacterium]